MKLKPALIIGASVAAILVILAAIPINIPTAQDAEAATDLLDYTKAKVHLDPDLKAFIKPAAQGREPKLIFYKVTDRAVQDAIVRAVAQYDGGSRIKKARLQFFEAQNWSADGRSRSRENLLREESVSIQSIK